MYNSIWSGNGFKFRSPLMKQELTDLLEQHRLFNEKNLVRISRQLVRNLTNEIGYLLDNKGYGDLSARHLHVFENLDASKTNIVTLAHRAGISKQAMSKLVKEVAEAGYVRVITDKNDSRLQVVLLNDKGGKFLTDLQSEIRRYRADILTKGILTDDEIRQTTRIMAKMNSYFEHSSKIHNTPVVD